MKRIHKEYAVKGVVNRTETIITPPSDNLQTMRRLQARRHGNSDAPAFESVLVQRNVTRWTRSEQAPVDGMTPEYAVKWDEHGRTVTHLTTRELAEARNTVKRIEGAGRAHDMLRVERRQVSPWETLQAGNAR